MNDYTRNILRKDIELSFTNNGEVEILISPYYGAGWSTWDDKYSLNLAIDKRIINFYKEYGKHISYEKIVSFLSSIGYEDVYAGGWGNIVIKKVPINVKFRIDEYDGYESLIIYEKDELYEL